MSEPTHRLVAVRKPFVQADVNAQFAMVFPGRVKGSASLIQKADSRHRRERLNAMACE